MRLYEAKGLFAPLASIAAGYRRCPAHTVVWVPEVRLLKNPGITRRDSMLLLAKPDQGAPDAEAASTPSTPLPCWAESAF